MIFDLGQSLLSSDMIRVTAEYSNAVLVAVLPYISDVAHKLDLPVPYPVTAAHVTHCSILPNRAVEAEIGVKGWVFAFSHGYVRVIQSDRSYQMLQDPDAIPRFFGDVKLSKAEAVELARTTMRKLGILPEAVFADGEPQVGGPHKVGTNTVPYYKINWPDPRGGSSVDIEINGNVGRVERIYLRNKSLERAPPKVSVVPPREHDQPRPATINPEYARHLVPIVFRAVDEYGKKLDLPVPRPLATNHVAVFRVQEDRGAPHVELELTNGWRFLYTHTMVNGFHAPGNLFGGDNRPITLNELKGEWKLSETQAIALVQRALAKLEYPTNLVHFEVTPMISKPSVPGIPRYFLMWDFSREGESIVTSAIRAEVDANKGELKSLYYGNMAFWNHGPKIDAPLTLPPKDEMDSVPIRERARSDKGRAENWTVVPTNSQK